MKQYIDLEKFTERMQKINKIYEKANACNRRFIAVVLYSKICLN